MMMLEPDDVMWIVNDIGELGVKIGEQFFFLYKGSSLAYDVSEDGPMMWRVVGKREFGEVCHPRDYQDWIAMGGLRKNGKYTRELEKRYSVMPDRPEYHWQPIPPTSPSPPSPPGE